ncbi:unnamed protein product [Adineta ricciae]|uniref:DYW domain-containing protein n=1 Tax=Adineta ricciae TaxID=249248 RepID=A0A814YLV3_ADIRI|nr:unnamed protein product [Adineta ricciae]CAF1230389.1 unnamed protein product [Adineta ricciae]
MIRLNKRKQFTKTLDLFDKHHHPDALTDRIIVQALKACSQLGSLERGHNIHKQLSNQSKNNRFIQASLIHFYMQCGRVNEAQRVFDSCVNKNVAHYGAMMKGFVRNNMPEKAIETFKNVDDPNEILLCLLFNSCVQVRTAQALDFGKRIWHSASETHRKDEYNIVAAFDMFTKCGDISSAEQIFDRMKRTVVNYGQMMKCYNNHCMHVKTINLYEKMKNQNIAANLVIFLLLINACAERGLEPRCRLIASQIPSSMLSDLKLQTTLIHMWGKVACVKEAKHIFDKIDKPNYIAYTAMINAYGLNGMGYDAIQLYHRIPMEMRDAKTHVCVLNACSHSGLVNECRSIFATIPNKNHYIYTTMVDCLSRSFLFDEAHQLIEEFERHQPPNLLMYMSLLSGARNQNDVSLARRITQRIKQLSHVDNDCLASASVLFTNILASSGDLEEASQLRFEMGQSGIRKKMGLSWTEVNGEIVEFRVKDRTHPRTEEIYDELHRIEKELIEHGHKFDSSWITRAMMPGETVASILNSHSERLALAYHFIQRPVPSRIQIVKNLRICGDCHGAIKLISQIRRCEIIIRDANRIHHFSDGKCSCNDHF